MKYRVKSTNTLVLFLALLLIFSQFAYSSQMKLYDYDDPDYIMVDKICRIAGVVGPSSATPITANELKIALDRVNPEILPERYRNEWYGIMESFDGDDDFSFDISMFLSPQVYLTVDQHSIDPNRFFIPFHERLPFAEGGISFSFGDALFMEASLDAINNSVIIGQNGIPYTSFDFIGSNRAPGGDWNFVSTKNPIQLYGEIPSLARGAIGNKWMNVIAGRSRHRMGLGYTGNMVVGDNYKFQEILKLTATSNAFTYTMDFTHFDIQDEKGAIDKPRFSGPQVLRLIHRFDFNVVNKLRIAANIGFSLVSDNIMDMRLITPLFMVHNWYNFREGNVIVSGDEANNIMSFEFDWMLIPRLRLSMQFVVDQMQMFWESDGVPDATGILLNLSYLQDLKAGDVEWYGEFVFTTANLYLNDKRNSDDVKNNNYDFSLGYFRRDTTGDIHWAGHDWGPDTLGGVLGAKFDLYDYNLFLNPYITYKTSGEVDYDTPYIKDKVLLWVGTPEHSLDLVFKGNWECYNGIEILAGLDFGFHWNYQHERGVFKFLTQSMIGMKFVIF